MSHRLYAPHVCLIQELVNAFVAEDHQLWREHVVVLPTGRLGTLFLASLAQRQAAFVPPTILTLEQLIRTRSGLTLQTCPDLSVDLLLAAHLEHAGYRHIRSGHERELRLFHNELHESGLRDTAFEELKRVLVEDVYKNEAHLGSLFQRVEEMEASLDALDKSLARHQWMTAAMARSAHATAWLERIEAGEDLERPLHLIGFTSAQRTWLPLLQRLAQDSLCAIWLHNSPRGYFSQSPHQELIAALTPHGEWESLSGDTPSQRRVEIITTTSRFAECAEALCQAERLLDAGLQANQVAIVVTQESAYGEMMRTLVRDSGRTANVALAQPLRQTVPGTWLTALQQFLEDPEDMLAFTAWLTHPITSAYFARMNLKPQEWTDALLSLLAAETLADGIAGLAQRSKRDDIGAMLTVAGQLLAPLQQAHALTLHDWLDLFEKLWRDIGLWDWRLGSEDLERSLQDAVSSSLQTLRALASREMRPWAMSKMRRLIFEQLLNQELRQIGEPLAGVQVLSLPEARGMPFAAAIILGCNEGSFPKGIPSDDLLDDYLKRNIGLPGWQALESMEDVTFHLLKERIPNLIMLRAAFEGETPTVRSRFIEKLLAAKAARETTSAFDPVRFWHGKEAADTATKRELELKDRLRPEGAHLAPRWEEFQFSASSIERLIRCPYVFSLQQRHLRELERPLQSQDAKLEGIWLHAVLEAFFVDKEHALSQDVLHDDLFEEAAIARLRALTLKIGPAGIATQPLFRHLMATSWPRFAQHVRRLFPVSERQRLAHGLKEQAFGYDQMLTLDLATRAHHLKGKIDSLDFSQGMVVVTDYKRSTPPLNKQVESALSPQLMVYAHLLHAEDPLRYPLENMLLGYYNIMAGVWEPRGVGDAVRQRAMAAGLVKKNTPSVSSLLENFGNILAWREGDVMAQKRFYADPSLGGACERCSYQGVCRRQEPSQRDYFAAQNALSAYLSADEGADA